MSPPLYASTTLLSTAQVSNGDSDRPNRNAAADNDGDGNFDDNNNAVDDHADDDGDDADDNADDDGDDADADDNADDDDDADDTDDDADDDIGDAGNDDDNNDVDDADNNESVVASYITLFRASAPLMRVGIRTTMGSGPNGFSAHKTSVKKNSILKLNSRLNKQLSVLG
jgi:hypothetical protein